VAAGVGKAATTAAPAAAGDQLAQRCVRFASIIDRLRADVTGAPSPAAVAVAECAAPPTDAAAAEGSMGPEARDCRSARMALQAYYCFVLGEDSPVMSAPPSLVTAEGDCEVAAPTAPYTETVALHIEEAKPGADTEAGATAVVPSVEAAAATAGSEAESGDSSRLGAAPSQPDVEAKPHVFESVFRHFPDVAPAADAVARMSIAEQAASEHRDFRLTRAHVKLLFEAMLESKRGGEGAAARNPNAARYDFDTSAQPPRQQGRDRIAQELAWLFALPVLAAPTEMKDAAAEPAAARRFVRPSSRVGWWRHRAPSEHLFPRIIPGHYPSAFDVFNALQADYLAFFPRGCGEPEHTVRSVEAARADPIVVEDGCPPGCTATPTHRYCPVLDFQLQMAGPLSTAVCASLRELWGTSFANQSFDTVAKQFLAVRMLYFDFSQRAQWAKESVHCTFQPDLQNGGIVVNIPRRPLLRMLASLQGDKPVRFEVMSLCPIPARLDVLLEAHRLELRKARACETQRTQYPPAPDKHKNPATGAHHTRAADGPLVSATGVLVPPTNDAFESWLSNPSAVRPLCDYGISILSQQCPHGPMFLHRGVAQALAETGIGLVNSHGAYDGSQAALSANRDMQASMPVVETRIRQLLATSSLAPLYLAGDLTTIRTLDNANSGAEAQLRSLLNASSDPEGLREWLVMIGMLTEEQLRTEGREELHTVAYLGPRSNAVQAAHEEQQTAVYGRVYNRAVETAMVLAAAEPGLDVYPFFRDLLLPLESPRASLAEQQRIVPINIRLHSHMCCFSPKNSTGKAGTHSEHAPRSRGKGTELDASDNAVPSALSEYNAEMLSPARPNSGSVRLSLYSILTRRSARDIQADVYSRLFSSILPPLSTEQQSNAIDRSALFARSFLWTRRLSFSSMSPFAVDHQAAELGLLGSALGLSEADTPGKRNSSGTKQQRALLGGSPTSGAKPAISVASLSVDANGPIAEAISAESAALLPALVKHLEGDKHAIELSQKAIQRLAAAIHVLRASMLSAQGSIVFARGADVTTVTGAEFSRYYDGLSMFTYSGPARTLPRVTKEDIIAALKALQTHMHASTGEHSSIGSVVQSIWNTDGIGLVMQLRSVSHGNTGDFYPVRPYAKAVKKKKRPVPEPGPEGPEGAKLRKKPKKPKRPIGRPRKTISSDPQALLSSLFEPPVKKRVGRPRKEDATAKDMPSEDTSRRSRGWDEQGQRGGGEFESSEDSEDKDDEDGGDGDERRYSFRRGARNRNYQDMMAPTSLRSVSSVKQVAKGLAAAAAAATAFSSDVHRNSSQISDMLADDDDDNGKAENKLNLLRRALYSKGRNGASKRAPADHSGEDDDEDDDEYYSVPKVQRQRYGSRIADLNEADMYSSEDDGRNDNGDESDGGRDTYRSAGQKRKRVLADHDEGHGENDEDEEDHRKAMAETTHDRAELGLSAADMAFLQAIESLSGAPAQSAITEEFSESVWD
jgi:hypothetical protein